MEKPRDYGFENSKMIDRGNLWKASLILVLIIMIFDLSLAEQSKKLAEILPISRYIGIQPDISLEVVDWGGIGKPLVFLAGLGHTAHVFDEFAPRFTDNFRVFGITRRGFGTSTQAPAGYNIDTLVNDIQIVLDSLHLEDVVLIGHSLGGTELTRLANRYKGRLSAIIYLDAAYAQAANRDSLKNYPLPEIQSPEPTLHDLQSAEAYRLFYKRVNGVITPLSEIKAMYNWNEDGSFGGGITPSRIYSQILESLQDQVYDDITLPALAIYGVEYPIEELFLDFGKADPFDQPYMMEYYKAGKRFAALSRNRFREQMQNGTVVELRDAGHSLYITHADQVEKEMRLFLDNIR